MNATLASAAVLVVSSAALAQDHAPTAAQCLADAKLWDAQAGQTKSDLTGWLDTLASWSLPTGSCGFFKMSNVPAISMTWGEISQRQT